MTEPQVCHQDFKCCQRCNHLWADENPERWWAGQWFIVCPTCGNKRCPKASHHDLACSGSNASGQPGSEF